MDTPLNGTTVNVCFIPISKVNGCLRATPTWTPKPNARLASKPDEKHERERHVAVTSMNWLAPELTR
jgi:hypothetical protein